MSLQEVVDIRFWILNDDGSTRAVDLFQWSAFFNKTDARRIAETEVNGCHVSTVFLGLWHGDSPTGPLIFETMIFGELDGADLSYCERYATKAEALAGHERALDYVRQTQKGKS